jgi:hypothetical protein
MEDIPEPVFVGLPVKLGQKVGRSLFDNLSRVEQTGISKAAEAIYETYLIATEGL